MPVAIYLRVSTEEQRERQSIDTQREFAARYCDLHQLRVYEVYADEAISGTVPLELRPAGRRVIEDARLGRFNQLLIFKLDRLGRETRLTLEAVNTLEKYGVHVKSMTEEFDASSPTGRLMLTLLSGFASHERDVIRERSVAGSLRTAEKGAWMGGIVPYGYRKHGERAGARLIPASEPIEGLGLSEVDVITMIFRMAAIERKSCRAIADHLNELRVPCAYTRDARQPIKGKRKQRTSGLWRAARVRNLIINRTYAGQHEYGKRSADQNRRLIVRQVTSLVDESTWQKAQRTLRENFIFGIRSARNRYLLRGLVKCELCGLTYVGTASQRPSGKLEFYYRCNGNHSARGLFGAQAKRCPSRSLNGSVLEAMVWRDVEAFLRNPGDLVEDLRSNLSVAQENDSSKAGLQVLRSALDTKGIERERILGLYRRGRIDEKTLDGQLGEIEAEAKGLQSRIDALVRSELGRNDLAATLNNVEAILSSLNAALDQSLSWEQKRECIETLVDVIRVNTVCEGARKRSQITITYKFPVSVATCMDTGSSPPPA